MISRALQDGFFNYIALREHSSHLHVKHVGSAPSDEIRENVLSAFHLLEHGIRERDVAIPRGCGKFDKAFWLANRKVTKQQRFDEGKYGSIRADSQRKPDYRHNREARILAQHADGITEIRPKHVHANHSRKSKT